MVIISLKKQRKISTSNLSLTGAISSLKQNRLIEFESSLERDYIHILEFNSNVLKYYEQPIKIEYFYKNQKRIYIPDFWVEYKNGTKEVIEIKYSEEINKKDAQLVFKLGEAKKFCSKNSLTFKVLTEKEVRTPVLKNAKFLSYYKTKNNVVKGIHINLIFSKLREYKFVLIDEFINSLSKDKYTQAEYLFTVWYLLSVGLIDFDQNKELSMTSVIHHKKFKK